MACRNAQPRDKIYRITDRQGLFLEIKPNGRRYWRYKYYFNGKEKRLYIGSYPDIGLSEARAQHYLARSKLIKEGLDPCEVKREDKQLKKYKAAQTFEMVGREWLDNYSGRWSESHRKNIKYRLEKDVFPRLGRYPISGITPPTVVSCIQQIELNGSEMARRALQMCSQIFRYAVQTGRADRNVTVDLKGVLKPVRKGHYSSIVLEKLPDLVKAIFGNKHRLFRQTYLLLQMMLLTFVRTRELTEARWSEVKFEKLLWTIPPERMKTRREHRVPLARQVLEILKELHTGDPDGYIFPSIINRTRPMSNNTILKALDTLGYNKVMTGHGFRALAMTGIKEKLKYPHDVVDRQLAHLPKSRVDQAYDRTQYLEERTKMMQEWADYIDTLK